MMCCYGSLNYSTREKIVKFLQSNPVQILLCVIVLLDAGVVIAQILLDLNSVKGIIVHVFTFSVLWVLKISRRIPTLCCL